MKIKYIGKEKSMICRDVIFPKNQIIDLTENPDLFKKVSAWEGFEIINEDQKVKAEPKLKIKRTRRSKNVDPVDLFDLGTD